MEIFIVGGAVRDELLGITPKDIDYVVVGATPQQMLDQGFEQVGADFPVFLHPETNDEYALARTERKVGDGYQGFDVDADPSTTLEDDLSRRDLTINAMAKGVDGTIYDPFNGQKDLTDKVLRHVSPAFAEDPLRVVRLARFFARYDGFEIATETFALCENMVLNGHLNQLPNERFWAEMLKVMAEEKPERFFHAAISMCMDTEVKFFHELYGSLEGQGPRLTKVMRAVMNAGGTPETRLMLHTAIFAKFEMKMKGFGNKVLKTAPVETQKLCFNLNKMRLLSSPNVDEVYDIIQAARGFSNENMDILLLVMAMNTAQNAGEFFVVDAAKVYNIITAGREVKAEQFPGVEGKELGDAIKQARKQKMEELLK